MLCHQPPGWEDDEVTDSLSWIITLSCQYCEYTRVRVIIADATNRVEIVQMVFERHIIAVPSHHIVYAVIHVRSEELTLELIHDFELTILIFIPSNRSLKISRICQPIGSNRTQIRQLEMSLVHFHHVPTHRTFTINTELHASWHHSDFLVANCESSHLGSYRHGAHLTHEQDVAI